MLDACKKLMPFESFVYVADSSHAPYGNKTDEQILERANACVHTLLNAGAKAIVAACNTATNVGIAGMRQSYTVPFVGLEPALKPASEVCGDEQVLLLCTQATANQPKFIELTTKYGGKNLCVLPQKNLAQQVENNQNNLEVLQPIIAKIFEPYPNAAAVVLGCTHYIYLRSMIQKQYARDIKIFDGNHGAAKQLQKKLIDNNLQTQSLSSGTVIFITL